MNKPLTSLFGKPWLMVIHLKLWELLWTAIQCERILWKGAEDRQHWSCWIVFKKSPQAVAVNNTEIKISQYADDTALILNGEQESLSATLNTINNFGCDWPQTYWQEKWSLYMDQVKCGQKWKPPPRKNFEWP